MNNFMIVGRITSDFVPAKLDGKDCIQVKLAIPRSFKNEDGEYDTDFIPVILFSGISGNVQEYCKKGDIVGIKGSIFTMKDSSRPYLCADKVTFLSSKASDVKMDEND